MANETTTTTRKPRRLLRWVGIIFGGLLLLLVVAYFVGTSGWALKSIILPKVSTAMNADVTVEDASISPFSAVTLNGLKVATKGPDPLVTAKEVRLRYSLMDIIKGNLNVQEVTLESPVVTLITFPDGTSNLDPITKKPKDAKAEDKKPSEPKDQKPPQLNLGKFALNNATVRKIDQRADGTKQSLELTGLNVTAEDIGNNKVGQLGLAANVRMDQGLQSASNGVFAATVGGKFNLQLDAALKPQVAKGQTKVDVTEAKGGFQQAAGISVTLNTDVTPTQLNDVSVRVAQNGKNLAAVAVNGPFNAETMEGKLAVVLSGVDRQVLSIVGGPLGIDFNQTGIGSTNTIELTQKGRVIAVNGSLLVNNFSVTQKGQTTPSLDVRTGYAVTYDQTNKTARIQTFTLNGTQNNAEFLRGTLAKPMLLDLGKSAGGVDESAFDLVITNFNLADWRAFAGTNVNLASGKLGVNLNLVSQQAGKKLNLNLDTRLSDLTVAAGSNRIENADIAFNTRGTVQDFSAVNLETYQLGLARGGQPALTAKGALQYNTRSQDADVQANLETVLPQVTALVSVPGLNLSAGTVKFAGRIVQKNTTPQQTNNPVLDRTVVGKLNVDELTGAFQSNRFDRFAAALDVDLAMNGDTANIRKLTGALSQSGQPGGTFDVSGNLNTKTQVGEINAQLVDLNQNALKSFLAAALGDKQLESVVINSKTSAKLTGPNDRAIKTELHVANLVVNDPTGQVPRTPLAVDLNADVAQAGGVADIKALQLALTKTERAPNSINVAGRIDMTKSNAWVGFLKVQSEGLDVTPYYDIFVGNKKSTGAVATTKSPAATAPTQPKPETEPAPMNLPVSLFTNDVNIARFFLREVAISNLISKTVIDNGRITVNPFSLTLNGAPVALSAIANVGVPGYQYDVTANLNRVPLEPIVNTFAPEKRGKVKGELLTATQIKGAGVTGPNLKKNLSSEFGFTLTNAYISVTDNVKLQRILKPIALALRVPQFAESPLNWVDVKTKVGNGVVNISNVTAESSVFVANIPASTVTLSDILTNSTLDKLPVDIALRRNIADTARLTPANTPTNAQYVPLLRFVSVEGTLGEPKPDIDKIAVTRILAGTVGNFVGGDAGKFLRGIGNLGTGTSTNAAGTNTTSTNVVGNLLQGIGGLLQKPAKTTNAPATNAPPKRGGFNLNDLIK